MEIIITRMWLDQHEVNVPPGLSELLNASGAWTKDLSLSDFSDKYDRQVEIRNGKLITILKKR